MKFITLLAFMGVALGDFDIPLTCSKDKDCRPKDADTDADADAGTGEKKSDLEAAKDKIKEDAKKKKRMLADGDKVESIDDDEDAEKDFEEDSDKEKLPDPLRCATLTLVDEDFSSDQCVEEILCGMEMEHDGSKMNFNCFDDSSAVKLVATMTSMLLIS